MKRRNIFKGLFGAFFMPWLPVFEYAIPSCPVIAKPRKLKTRWSAELEQELLAMHDPFTGKTLGEMLSEKQNKA